MTNTEVSNAFESLSTPLIADACLRVGATLRVAPGGIRPIRAGMKLAGRVRPVRHYGSVDVFLEAVADSREGDVLVIDNAGRADEGCIGDLTVLETRAAGLAGVVLWGRHRDSAELNQIGFRVFSYGSYPAGPVRLDAREPAALVSARFGSFVITREDAVFGDGDGVLFAPMTKIVEIIDVACSIRDRERKQAEEVRNGRSLRAQFRFEEYLQKRATEPAYSFRAHLRTIGGAIEE